MKEKYDVVIIGTGIGGLICGCYLAKAGLKTLIVEQHDKPGGYCTSFQRKGFKFDVGVHYLGGIKRGILGKILEELDLKAQMKFNQCDPTDKIVMSDNRTYIRAMPQDTIREFQKSFPDEKRNIEIFFAFIMQKNFLNIYSKVKGKSFGCLLDTFFCNLEFKKMLNKLLWGVLGVSFFEVPSWIGVAIWREFFLDPGYYPVGGIEKFPETLTVEIRRCQGDLLFSKKVVQILEKNNRVKEVLLDNGSLIETQNVVANFDPFQLSKLIQREMLSIVERNDFTPSCSAVVIYLGIKANLNERMKDTCCVWNFLNCNREYFLDCKEKGNNINNTMLIFSPSSWDYHSNKSTLQICSLVPYESEAFWTKHKKEFCEQIISDAEKIIPSLRKYVDIKEIATPSTFEKYTLNKNGAILGRKIFPSLNTNMFLSKSNIINGLFFTGAWYSYGGVSEVAISGKRTAEIVLSSVGIKKKYKLFKL